MAITTYLKDNDYKQLDFKPYELNYEAVLKETAVKQQYWLQGVSKVQTAWKAINDLDPINEDNRANLKRFNDETKEQFNKLARTDLALSENQEQIKNIIKPLYDVSNKTSKSILYDSYTNTFYKDEFEKVESYKTRDKGAFYNVNNDREVKLRAKEYYDLKGYKGEDLADKMEEMYKNKRGYTPYYDYTKTIQTAIDKCPEHSSKIPQITSQTYITESIKEKTFSSLMDCITFAVSQDSKAAQQMAIDGYVKFHDSDGNKNVGALRDFYQNDLRRQVDQTNLAINDLNGQLASLPKNTDPKLIEGYKTMGESLKTQLKNLFSEIEASSDLNYVAGKFDELSSSAWMNGVIAKAALSHDYMNVDTDQQFHEAYLAGVNYQYDYSLQERRLQYQDKINQDNINAAIERDKLKNGNKLSSNLYGDALTVGEEGADIYGYNGLNFSFNQAVRATHDSQVSEFNRLKEIAQNQGMDVSQWGEYNPNSEGFKNYNAFKEAYYQPKYIDVKTQKVVYIDPKTKKPVDENTPGYMRVPIDNQLSQILDIRRRNEIQYQLLKRSKDEIDNDPDVIKQHQQLKKDFKEAIKKQGPVTVNTEFGKFSFDENTLYNLFEGKEVYAPNGVKIVISNVFSNKNGYFDITVTKGNKTSTIPIKETAGFDLADAYYIKELGHDDIINKKYGSKLTKNTIFANISEMNTDDFKSNILVTTLSSVLGKPGKDFNIVATDGNRVVINMLNPQVASEEKLTEAFAFRGSEVKKGKSPGVYFISNLPGVEEYAGSSTSQILNNEIQKFIARNKSSLNNTIIDKNVIQFRSPTSNYSLDFKWDKTTGASVHLRNESTKEEKVYDDTPQSMAALANVIISLPTN